MRKTSIRFSDIKNNDGIDIVHIKSWFRMAFLSKTISTLVVLTSILASMKGKESSLMKLEQLCDELLRQVEYCDVEQFVLITDTGSRSVDEKLNTALVDSLSWRGIVFLHYVIDKNTTDYDIIEIIKRHTYHHNNDKTTFLVTTSRFDDVIKCACRCAVENVLHQCGQVWLHHTRWMIVTNLLKDVNRFLASQEYIPMDNIAFVTLRPGCSHRNSVTTTSPVDEISFYTLMWKFNRTRKLEPISVTYRSKPINVISQQCLVFPNIHYHLNGRHLKVITKVHWGFFVFIDNNPISGNLEYQGFLPDVLYAIASSLNFTFTLTPSPSLDAQPSWDDVANNVTSGEVDFSATSWSYSWVDLFNISISYPIVLDTFTGVYRRPILSDEYMSLYILCPFNSITYLILIASLVYTLIMYVLIVEVCYRDENNITPRNPFNAERRKSIYLRRKTSNPVQPRKKGRDRFPGRLRKLAWSLGASVLNQAYLPRPKQMSARVLLFLWSFSMVMFYAIYTGSLTAELINSSDNEILDSFQSLVNEGRYNWGTTDQSIIDKVMVSQKSNAILSKLNQGKSNIPDGKNGDIYYVLKDKLETLEHMFVLIHFKSLLNQIIGTMDKPEDYLMMKDSLISANQGFIWRKITKLEPLFSEHFRKMHDSGLIAKIYENYAYGNRSVSTMSTVEGETKRRTLTLNNIRWPLIIISLLVLLSLLILLVEKIWHPVNRLRVLKNEPT